MKYMALLLLVLSFNGAMAATDGKALVTKMLKSNPVVQAAVAEAKKNIGAKKCSYTVTAKPAPGYQAGSAFDYSATISCTDKGLDGESSGMVNVEGTYLGTDGKSGFEEFTLSIRYAG